MFADVGGVPTVITKGDDHKKDDSGIWGASGMWLFALVIIFLALVFLWGRNDKNHVVEPRKDYGEALIPMMAMSEMNKNRGYDQGYHGHNDRYAFERFAALENHQWDIVRDDLKEFGHLKQEISDKAYGLSREMDRGYSDLGRIVDNNKFENCRQIDNTRYELSRQNDQIRHQNSVDTRLIIEGYEKRFSDMERSIAEREIQALRDKLMEERLLRSQVAQDKFIALESNRVIDAVRPYPRTAYLQEPVPHYNPY